MIRLHHSEGFSEVELCIGLMRFCTTLHATIRFQRFFLQGKLPVQARALARDGLCLNAETLVIYSNDYVCMLSSKNGPDFLLLNRYTTLLVWTI